MKEHRGWIALDIDGTITDHSHRIPPRVMEYLTTLSHQGWQITFITGRTLSFGSVALKECAFPFFLGVQNGSAILNMPSQHIISLHYLPRSIVNSIAKIYANHKEDFIIYAGFEKGDLCYYRPAHFSPNLLKHVQHIATLSLEPWQALQTFDCLEQESFPLIKCLGSYEFMVEMYRELQTIEGIAVSMIRDPLEENTYLNLVTASDATKGEALRHIIQHVGQFGPILAAGDDLNDMSMLRMADVSIVMETAPKEMLSMATIIGASAQHLGIIEALEQAISLVKR